MKWLCNSVLFIPSHLGPDDVTRPQFANEAVDQWEQQRWELIDPREEPQLFPAQLLVMNRRLINVPIAAIRHDYCCHLLTAASQAQVKMWSIQTRRESRFALPSFLLFLLPHEATWAKTFDAYNHDGCIFCRLVSVQFTYCTCTYQYMILILYLQQFRNILGSNVQLLRDSIKDQSELFSTSVPDTDLFRQKTQQDVESCFCLKQTLWLGGWPREGCRVDETNAMRR